MPNKWGIRKFYHPHPEGLSFLNKGEHLTLVLLCKANLEHKEICAFDWLKPIFTLLIQILFVFFIFAFLIWFLSCKKPTYSSSIGSVEEH